MVSIVLELLSDKNPNIKGLVNAILDYVQLHDEMWKNEIKMRRFQVHNSVYLEIMDEYEKQYPMEAAEGEYDERDEMYYYDQMSSAAQAQFLQELANLSPQERAAQIQQMRAMAAANGELNAEEFDSEDDALFFDNNDLANRIWEDNELE